VLLVKPDRSGIPRVHPHMLGYRQGRFRLIWGGSPRPTEIRDLALGDFDNDGRNEVALIEGGATATAPGTSLAVYRWQSWFFYEEWRSSPGTFYAVDARDLDGDGTPELLAETDRDAAARSLIPDP
jgi:hypothetical protein